MVSRDDELLQRFEVEVRSDGSLITLTSFGASSARRDGMPSGSAKKELFADRLRYSQAPPRVGVTDRFQQKRLRHR